MKYETLVVGALATNCYLVYCEETREGAVVDPGAEAEKIFMAIDRAGIQPVILINTHGHIDHIGYTAELAAETGLPVIGPHRDDRFLLESLDEYGAMLGLPHSGPFEPDQWLDDGDQISLGEQTLQVIHCPGHTPGHIIFYHADSKLAIVGDVIFQHSIGRTDFPRSNHEDLLNSIKTKLLPLGDEIEFIPGHGPNSSFGEDEHDPA